MTESDTPKDVRQSLAMNTEAARAGLFAAAQDMLDMMKENGVIEAEPAVMTGAVEMAVQLWMQVALRTGVTPGKARATLEGLVRDFINKHRQRVQTEMKNEEAQALLEAPANDAG